MNLLTKQKETHRLRKQTYSCQGEEIAKDFGKVMYTRLYLKWMTNKYPLYGTWNSCSVLRASLDGRGVWERRDTCVCMAESLCCSPETITALLIGYNPIQNKKVNFKKRAFLEKRKAQLSSMLA